MAKVYPNNKPKVTTTTNKEIPDMFKSKFPETENMPEPLKPIPNAIAQGPQIYSHDTMIPPQIEENLSPKQDQSLLKQLGQDREFIFDSLQFHPATGEFEVTVKDMDHVNKNFVPIRARYYSVEDAMNFVNRMGCSNGPTNL